MQHRGLLIVIEGINGSGKTTIINKVLKLLPSSGKYIVYKFPDRTGLGGSKIDDFLKKKIELGTYDKLKLFSDNRKACLYEMLDLLNKGVSIICDRYVYSAIVYQLNINNHQNWYINTIINIVGGFDNNLIVPDIVFLINGQFLHLREKAVTNPERYHHPDVSVKIEGSQGEDSISSRLFDKFRVVLTKCKANYFVINNEYDELNDVANYIVCTIRLEDETKYFNALSPRPIRYFQF